MLIFASLLFLTVQAGSLHAGKIVVSVLYKPHKILYVRYYGDSLFIVSVTIIGNGGPPVVGQSYNLTCSVSQSESTSSVTSYQWKKEGEPLNNKADETLVFSSLHLSHAGNYTCEVPINNTASHNFTIIPQGMFCYNNQLISE